MEIDSETSANTKLNFGKEKNTSLSQPIRFHRLATVRQREGVTLRSLARRMGSSVRELRAQEDETRDISVSTLMAWQRALDVPLEELISETPDYHHPDGTIIGRARLLKIMKTVLALQRETEGTPAGSISHNLELQLLDLMPELKGVKAWPTKAKMDQESVPKMLLNTISDDLLAS